MCQKERCVLRYLEPVRWVAPVRQEELDHGEVAARARQRQHGVVVRGRLAVHVGALADEELHGAEVAGARRLHQWGAASLRLVLLQCTTICELLKRFFSFSFLCVCVCMFCAFF